MSTALATDETRDRWTAPHARRRPAVESALLLTRVGKTYTAHGAVEALRGIDLDVASGELVAIIGPRGSGASTLLAMIAGLEPASSGRIVTYGRRVRGAGDDRVLLFSDAGLFPWLDARRNVEFALRHRRLAAFERAAIARRALDLVSLHRAEHMPASALSPGQAHRVALARALATDPAILLLDEPFAELDPRMRSSLHDELLAVWTATRKTIVLATHDPLEAVTLADRVIVLSPSPGRIVAEFRIDVPRPRRADDPALLARARDLSAGVQTRAA